MESAAIQDPTLRMPRDGLGLTNEYTAPESKAERQLAEIWREALNFDRIGVDDDFFDLGGDSVGAVTIAAAVLMLNVPEPSPPVPQVSIRSVRRVNG